MTDSSPSPDRISTPTESPLVLDAIHAWLDDPAQFGVTDELTSLLTHLAKLRNCETDHQHRSATLAKICRRAIAHIEKLLPTLAALSPPTPRKLRQTVRSAQELLRTLAEDLISVSIVEPGPAQDIRESRNAALWHSMNALSLHLLISNLATMPSKGGVWRLLHTAYDSARRLGIETEQASGTPSTARDAYFTAVLLECAQPASLTSRETSFVADYLARHAHLVHLADKPRNISPNSFWIDPERDAPATPSTRKAAPEDAKVIHFDCADLATLIGQQLAALSSGIAPSRIGLGDFAGTPSGRGAMRRLGESLGNPGKRRFPRRRQHYRVVLCAGLENLWRLYSYGVEAKIETSSWMITNESPDGCLIMHVLGDSSGVSVGDIVAIRAETGDRWQVCIARWSQSENQEHLEFGLQILAPSAVPAMLAAPRESSSMHDHSRPQPVLVLPRVPPLRLDELLVTPSGLLAEQPSHLVLVVEQGNIEVREVRNTRLSEQNGLIEVFTIEPEGDQP